MTLKNHYRTELFTGSKSTRLEDLPEEAWTILTSDGLSVSEGETARLYAAVSWLYRCIDIRAGAVSSMPWKIRRGETTLMTSEEEAPEQLSWLYDLPDLLYRTEASLLLTGQAYWFRERNLMRTLNVRWLHPSSIAPRLSREGLQGFTRTLGGESIPYEVDDIIYFWLPDPYVELGPAKHWPGKAALGAASVLSSMEVFLAGYFERGMIKATLLKYMTPISVDEGQRVKEWWQRVAAGLKNAFATEVVRGDFETLVVGEGLHDLQNTALTQEQRESICTALGVPQSKVTANAANFATANQDARAFIQDTIAPQCRWIASTLNRQLLGPAGLHLEFSIEELPVMQEDEAARAASLVQLVQAGMSLEMATAVLGYDLPEGFSLRDERQAEQLQPREEEAGEAGERREEIRRFMRWARKRTDPDPALFRSDVLTLAERTWLLGQFDFSPQSEDGQLTGDAPFRWDGSQGYP